MSLPADFGINGGQAGVKASAWPRCVLIPQRIFSSAEHGSRHSRQRHIDMVWQLTAEIAAELTNSPRWASAEVERLYIPRSFFQWLRGARRDYREIRLLRLARLRSGDTLELSDIGSLHVRVTYGQASALSHWKFARTGYLAHPWDYAHRANTPPADAAVRLDHIITALLAIVEPGE